MRLTKIFISTGVTPAKLAIIAVLAIVLLVVVVIQIPSTSSPNQSPSAAQEQIKDSRTLDPNNRKNVNSQFTALLEAPPKVWSEIPLETILAYDPFAAPAWTRDFEEIKSLARHPRSDASERESIAADRQLLAKLRADGVSFVVIAGEHRLAQIGQTELHEGDRIGGFIVQDIGTNGVVLIENHTP